MWFVHERVAVQPASQMTSQSVGQSIGVSRILKAFKLIEFKSKNRIDDTIWKSSQPFYTIWYEW